MNHKVKFMAEVKKAPVAPFHRVDGLTPLPSELTYDADLQELRPNLL